MTQTDAQPSGCPMLHYNDTVGPGVALDYYSRFDDLREQSAVFRGDIADFWLFTRYSEMRELITNPDVFSNTSVIHLDPDPSFRWIPENLDPPEHSAWRRLLAPLFSPARMVELEPIIRRVAVDYIEELRDAGRCEFVKDFALKFPTKVFVGLMGLPESDTDKFVAWEDATVRAADWTNQEEIGRIVGEILAYMQELIVERRANPGDDILSAAVKFEIDGRPVSDEDLQSLCLLLFMAGLDTVTTTLSLATLYLANHPEQQVRLRDEPEIIPAAVEEMVRFFAPAAISRKVMEDVDFHGCPLKKGQMVWIPLWMGNHDSRGRDGADQVVLDRPNNNHIGFGAGAHRCLGQHLARLELQVALEEWHKRIPPYQQEPGQHAEQRVAANMTIDRVPIVWDV